VSGRLAGRRVVLGITGSIAAYKAPELVRAFQAEGATVHCLLTSAAQRFVTPLTLATLTGRPVETDVLALDAEGRIGHIELAAGADVVVVAPATAHWLAAMAAGLAGDPVTALCLATRAPVVVAPAMDGEMWRHPAVQAAVLRLANTFGYRIVPPDVGPLASGREGPGRLAAPERIIAAAVRAVADSASGPGGEGDVSRGRSADLAGRHIVVTAGGTAEPLDPVRFLGNRSSGRQGVAIATAAAQRGARVTLVAGHLDVPVPPEITLLRAETTEAMGEALAGLLVTADGGPGFDVLVMAAAVADFRPRSPLATKLERTGPLTVELEPTPDLLAGLAARAAALRPRPILVGFAAETGTLERAAAKVAGKGVDLIVANDVSDPQSGFGSETNRVTLFAADGTAEPWPLLSKVDVAHRLLDRVVRLLAERDAEASRRGPEGAPEGSGAPSLAAPPAGAGGARATPEGGRG
jgi:phosphopantothenoylcysteine decarboxylase/phosphopantothenate--cysteine ligase